MGDNYYHARNGRVKDEKMAFFHWRQAAEFGSIQCLKNLAWAYRDGIGVEKDEKLYKKWQEKYDNAIAYYSDPRIQQDRWVESVFNGKRDGYYIEVGASTGVGSSNCCMFERRLGWNGICIEPNPDFFKELVKNRKAICVNTPIAPDEREVQFRAAGYYGGIQENLLDHHRKNWESAPLVTMNTRRLEDILEEHGAPPFIDYISLDIEGGEAAIIESFPFDRYRVLTMTIEQSDERLTEIVESKGFNVFKNPFSDPSVNWELHCVHESIMGIIKSDSYRYHSLGDDYFHGRNGKEKSEEKAVEFWLKGAFANNVQCMENLSWAYLHGFGVRGNALQSGHWKSKAVKTEKENKYREQVGLNRELIHQEECRKSIKAYPNDIEVGEHDIVLITQYYVDKECPMREAETDLALKRNLANPSIKKVVLFLEEDIDIPFKSDKVERVFINDWTTYKDGFDYMRGKPGVKLMANSDIYFNPDIIRIANAHFDNRIICFLRANLNPDNGEIEEEAMVHRHKSSDAWAWRELPPFKSNMYLGVHHCENRMLVNAVRSGIDVLNVGDIFSAIHVHWNEKRPATNYEGRSNYGPCPVHWRLAEESEVFNCDRNTPRSLIDYIGSSIVSDRIVRDKYLDICDMVYQHEGSSWSTFLRERGYDGEHVEGNKPVVFLLQTWLAATRW
jgi:FkbM family methyltransferase